MSEPDTEFLKALLLGHYGPAKMKPGASERGQDDVSKRKDTETNRPCTCHPDDNPPIPCAQMFALTECRNVAALEAVAWIAEARPNEENSDAWRLINHARRVLGLPQIIVNPPKPA